MTFSQNGNGRLTLKQQMLMKGILYDFSRHNARNAQHAQFVTNILDAVPRDVAEAQGFATQRVAFAEAVDNELRYFHSEKAYLDTPQIVAANQKRDQAFYFYKQIILAHAAYQSDAALKKAGTTLAFAFRGVGRLTNIDYSSKTSILTDLIGKLREEPYVTALAAIGLADAPDALEEANTAFNTIYLKRAATERDRAQSWNMKTLRPLSDAAFDDLAKAINALYISNELVAGDEAIRTELGKVIDDVNAVIVRLKKTMNQGAAGVDPSEDEPGDTTPTPEPEEPEPGGDEGGSPL
jgi:hypothetical protein